MANNLIFPIGFDLAKGVAEIGNAWERKYAGELEKRIQKRAIAIKLKLDTSSIKGLEEALKKLEKIRIGGGSGGTRGASTELVGFRKQLADLTKEWNKLTAAERGGAAGAALRERYRALQREAQGYVSTLRAAVNQEDKLKAARDKAAAAAGRGANATRNASREFRSQEGYVSRLIKRLAVYAGFQQIAGFLTKVREVTAQFELQRISLGAIIQDQSKANAIFSEIKQFALKSPVKILDLTKYTKQVAAYRIETDKLWDTTKRLADVSVGLGVDMGRIVLAYGQVKAASYLRAAEIRQFTEAGIPMLELLAEKFTKLNGEAVSTEQVMQMVSKRMVSFSMVEEIFNDMTSAGGMFYNMQEKQGNTLYGMWAKLGDAASIMYDEIGNTDSVNSGMKSLIRMLTWMMKNWERVGAFVLSAAAAFMVYRIWIQKVTLSFTIQKNAILRVQAAQKRLNAATAAGNVAQEKAARKALKVATLQTKAAMATNRWTRALYRLRAALAGMSAGNWLTLALTVVVLIAEQIWMAVSNANKLQNELAEINSRTTAETISDVSNFENLANIAVRASAGTKEQKNALDELKRTYKDIIPEEALTIENLRNMKGNYDSLTDAIRAYHNELKKEEYRNKINEKLTDENTDRERKLPREIQHNLYGVGTNISEEEATRYMMLLAEQAKNGVTGVQALKNAWLELYGVQITATQLQALQNKGIFEGQNTLMDYIDAIAKYNGMLNIYTNAMDGLKQAANPAIKNFKLMESVISDGLSDNSNKQLFSFEVTPVVKFKTTEWYQDHEGVLKPLTEIKDDAISRIEHNRTEISSKYAEALKSLGVDINTVNAQFLEASSDTENTFLSQQQKLNAEVLAMAAAMKVGLATMSADLPSEFLNLQSSIQSGSETLISSIDFEKIEEYLKSKGNYLALALVQGFRSLYVQKGLNLSMIEKDYNQAINNISVNTGVNMGKLQKYLISAGGSFREMKQQAETALQGIEDKLAATRNYLLTHPFVFQVRAQLQQQEAEKAALGLVVQELDKRIAPTNTSSRRKSGSGRKKEDPRLQNLKEEISLVQKLYKDYQDLEKQMGATDAAAEMRKLYPNTFVTLAKKFEKYGAVFHDPFNAEALIADLKALRKHMASLPKGTFKTLEKDLAELDYTIEHIRVDEFSKTIEKQLSQLADKISRSKAAKEFYEKILSQTGDYQMAASLTVSIFGEDGSDLRQEIIDNIHATLSSMTGLSIDISSAINADKSINYNELVRIAEAQLALGNISEEAYKKILKMRDEDRKDLAKSVEGWMKATEKAKSFSDKIIDLSRRTSAEIAKIEEKRKNGRITNEFADQQIQLFKDKEAREAEKLEYEAFINTPLYTQMFEDLENASTFALESMRNRLIALRGEWQNLDPTQIKELQERLDEIDAQLAKRNPFTALGDAWKKWQSLRKSGRTRGGDEAAAQAAEDARKAAWDKMMADEAAYQAAVKASGADSEAAKAAREVADASKQAYDTAEKTANETAKSANEWKTLADGIDNANAALDEYQDQVNQALDGVLDMMEALGTDAADLEFFRTVKDGLNQIFDGAQAAAKAVGDFSSGKISSGVFSSVGAITSIVSGISNIFYAGKIRKANKEIERQQEVLEQLEYTYGRLEKAAEKLFGADYLSNYNTQIRNLRAQMLAYQKQAEAERSKGKKADKEKIKEYEEAIRDTADEIKAMQEELTAKFLGSDRTSLAREFAESWLDAKASFASTTDAIKSKYKDMIRSMIVEGAAAKLIDNILAPMWEQMDKKLEGGDTAGAIDYVVNGLDSFMQQADNGLNVLWESLEAKGYDLKELLGDAETNQTGIAKQVASASSEEINAVAAIGNSLLYYNSKLPVISDNIAIIRQMLEVNPAVNQSRADASILSQQAMDNLVAIERHTAETVIECRNIAAQCQEQVTQLRRVITPKNSSSAVNAVQVRIV